MSLSGTSSVLTLTCKTAQCWRKNRHKDPWNRRESLEINPRTYGQLIHNNEARLCKGENSVFNKWYWEHWTTTRERMKLEYFLMPSTKINSECTKDANVRLEAIKPLEENIGCSLTSVLAISFWICPLRQEEKKQN